MPIGDVVRVVVSHEHLTRFAFPDKHLLGEVNCDGWFNLHQRRSQIRVSEEDDTDGSKLQPHRGRICLVIDLGHHGNVFVGLQSGYQSAVRRFHIGIALENDQPTGHLCAVRLYTFGGTDICFIRRAT